MKLDAARTGNLSHRSYRHFIHNEVLEAEAQEASYMLLQENTVTY